MQDPILGITENFLADQDPKKMNLGVVRPFKPLPACVECAACGLRWSVSPVIPLCTQRFRLLSRRINLQGAYRDDDGQPVVLKCVREAEKRIAGNKFMECDPLGQSGSR